MPGTSGARGLYDTPEWRDVRPLIRKRDPRCKGPCGGRNSTRYVDHIIAVKDGGAPLDPDNLQGLCRPCHQLKSRIEQGQRGDLAGNVKQRSPLVPGVDPATGIPNDPSHPWNRP